MHLAFFLIWSAIQERKKESFWSSCQFSARKQGWSITDVYVMQGVYLWEKGGETKEIKEKAAEHLVISAKLNPQNAAAFKYLGHYYSRLSHDSQRAIKCYQRAITLNPDDSDSGVCCVPSSSFSSLLSSSMFSGLICLKMIHRKHSVTCWTERGRRAWSWPRAAMPLTSHRGLSGLSADWDTCRFFYPSRVFSPPHIIVFSSLLWP